MYELDKTQQLRYVGGNTYQDCWVFIFVKDRKEYCNDKFNGVR